MPHRDQRTGERDGGRLMSGYLAGAPLLESPAKTAYVAARALDYLGTALFFGGLAFVTLLWPAGSRVAAARRLLVIGWSLGLLGTVAAIGLEGAWAAQLLPSAAWRWTEIRQVLLLDFGRQWAAKALLWILAGVVLADLLRRCEHAATSLAWRVGAGTIALGTLRVIGLTGHSRDTAHRAVSQLADLVHLTAMSLWIGGLAVLLFGVLPRRRPAELREVVPRYSTLAMLCVLCVIASGMVLAWQVLGGLGALVHTTYGHVLITKLLLLAAVLAAAWCSKTWVAHRLDFAVVLRGDRAVVRPFVYSVAAETALVLLVLIAASLLVTANPGR
jgi:copper transport protein